MVRFAAMLILAAIPVLVRAEPADLLEVSVSGAATTVFSHQREACELWDIPDAPARAIRDVHGEVLLFAAHFRNHLLRGGDLLHVHNDCRVVFAGAENDDPAAFDDRGWLTAPFSRDGVNIFVVVHDEFQGHRRASLCPSGRYMDCWYNALTLAVSHDGGAHFQRTGLVAALPYRYDEVAGAHRGYFNPSNIVTSGDYQFMMVFATQAFTQLPGNCLLRTEHPEQPDGWRGWDGAGFNIRFIDPYREKDAAGKHVCAPVGVGQLRWPVTSLVLHRPSGLFIATMQNAAADGGVYIATSPDLLRWSNPLRLMSGTGEGAWHCGAVPPIAYPSILDPDSDDRSFATVGDFPSLFMTQYNSHDCALGPDRDLIRVPLSIQLSK